VTAVTCGWAYEYDDRICARPKGHLDLAAGLGYDLHQSADGFWWIHHEEPYGDGEDAGVETWDEPSNERGETR
jgi:hypothetical protein